MSMFAIAEFGSFSRNTADDYSDRDLLVVCPDKNRYRLHKRYEKSGHNVTSLSREQLTFMKSSGSLFLQHLRNEANILIDSDGALRSFLDDCDLVRPTESEIARCESTLQFIAACPHNLELCAWKADFLFCVSRDYLIKRIAKTGRVSFGLETIGKLCQELFDLGAEDFASLQELRKAKTAYRSEIKLDQDLPLITDRWLSVLRQRFNIDSDGLPTFDFDSDAQRLALYPFSSAYERLRCLEGLYLAAWSRGIVHPEHKQLMKCIKEPNLYKSSRHCKVPEIRRYIKDLGTLVANAGMQGSNAPLRFTSLRAHP